MGVEVLAGLEGDGVVAALGVGELNPVAGTGTARAGPWAGGTGGGFGHVSKAIEASAERSGPREGLGDVLGGEHAVHLAGRFDQEVLGGGARLDGGEEVLAGDVGGQDHARGRGRG